ncbi:MAG: AAA domain-containing protein [Phocaeicola sp.]|nr:AAA domain-containing protein [Prevotellaceae bacterium]MDY3914241.1 AAA domain-containing protein [Phocaeicola sp.]
MRKSKVNETHIHLQGFDFFTRIEQIHRATYAPHTENLRKKYILLKKLLEEVAYEYTRDTTFTFANLFSRIDYICKQYKIVPSDRFAIQTMRRNCHKATVSETIEIEEYRYDLRALVRFISIISQTAIPEVLACELPHTNRPYKSYSRDTISYLRVVVNGWNERIIYANTAEEGIPSITINYQQAGEAGSYAYLEQILKEHTQLNLLNIHINEAGEYVPQYIIFQPDFLLDISSIALCFKNYGRNPLNYFLSKLQRKEITQHTLLGNFAGKLLDDCVHNTTQQVLPYSTAIQEFFCTHSLDFCSTELSPDFHIQAQAQLQNLHHIIHHIFPKNIAGFDHHQILLEASFICEKLGIQGRVDMLQKDFSILVEQKSGKKDEWKNLHKEEHFVQVMLYQGVLTYNFNISLNEIQSFLLYSKYADGLMLEHHSSKLFEDTIRLRNLIVSSEIDFAEGRIEKVLENLSTDALNEFRDDSKLWKNYQKPALERQINVLQERNELEKAYFKRYYTFVSKEQLLNKTGGRVNSGKGLAALWHLTTPEKKELGNILLNLKITDLNQSSPGKGYDVVQLEIPPQGEDTLPNFRKGDMIILYPYKEDPDVRTAILMKGHIENLSSDKIIVRLRNGQHNKDIIGGQNDTFAIEHDILDSSYLIGYKGLYALMAGEERRRELLLGSKTPEIDTSVTLSAHYNDLDELVLKSKQNQDFFLLIGPPGTGKTSQALQYIVKEHLAENFSILLLAYTNRAVDEICEMLIESGIEQGHTFIRIGNDLACSEKYTPYLLKNKLKGISKLTEVKNVLQETSIYVSTISSMNGNLQLFKLKQFDVCIIDEASQALEPDLLGILASQESGANDIKKFILIGDYKQLPAISLQTDTDAKIEEELLIEAGFTDCRMSLFERLYRQAPPYSKHILRKQGRMHPAIAEFSVQTFYKEENIIPVPLAHQKEEEIYPHIIPQNKWQTLIMGHRMLFIDLPLPINNEYADKSNINEARIITILLREIYDLTKKHFDPQKTVGIIVPYRNQIAMIRQEIRKLNIIALEDITIDTVERYQGSQRDIILYSFTIRNYSQMNFLTAQSFSEENSTIDRKLNVAITRARKQLILVGSSDLLVENLTFYKLITYIKKQSGYVRTHVGRFTEEDFSLPKICSYWSPAEIRYDLGIYGKQMEENYLLPAYAQVPSPTITAAYELCQYGRSKGIQENFPQWKSIFQYYYWRKQYLGASHLWKQIQSILMELLLSAHKTCIFCDAGYEMGESFVSLIDTVLQDKQVDATYIGTQPHFLWREESLKTIAAMNEKNLRLCTTETIAGITAILKKQTTAHRKLVIINLSHLFDRIDEEEAKELASKINHLYLSFPHEYYLIICREDTYTQNMPHSYEVFCRRLHPQLIIENKEMPLHTALEYTIVREKEETRVQENYVYSIFCNVS